MNCPNCGAYLSDNKCEYCGYELQKESNIHNVHIYHHNVENQNNNFNNKKKMNTGILVLLWFLFLPIMAIYTIWQSKNLNTKTKIILTIIIATLLILLGALGDNNDQSENEIEKGKHSYNEKIENNDWNINIYDIKVDYDIDNQAVLLIDLEIEYIGEYAFEANPSDLEYTLKNNEKFIFIENKYYGKKDLEVDVKTNDKYIGTIGFNIDPDNISNYILNITNDDYERKCDIFIRIDKSEVFEALNN